MRYVYDYNTHAARFYILNGYAYGMEGQQAHFWIRNSYWYPVSGIRSQAEYWEKDQFIYGMSTSDAAFYFA